MSDHPSSTPIFLTPALQAEPREAWLSQKQSILLIGPDGDSEMEILGSYLKSTGYHIAILPPSIKSNFSEINSPKLIIMDYATIPMPVIEEIEHWYSWMREIPILGLFSAKEKWLLSSIAYTKIVDYIVKPVKPEELKTRVMLQLREARAGQCSEGSGYPFIERRSGNDRRKSDRRNAGLVTAVHFGAKSLLCINMTTKQVRIDGRLLSLTPKEFDLLAYLASEPGRVFTDHDILARLWSNRQYASSTDIAQYVHRLRRKLGDNASNPKWLVNVKRFGYKLNNTPC